MMECYILAGGQSKRFGEDKLLFKIGSLKVIEYVLKAASEVCPSVYIVTKNRRKFEDLKVPVIEDLLPDQTPLVGLYTALKHTQEDKILLLGADIPLIKPEVLQLLFEKFEEPITLFSINGKLQPLVGIYSKALYPIVEEHLKIGKRSFLSLLRSLRYKVLKENTLREVDPELCSLINMNTKEDLRLILKKMEEMHGSKTYSED